MWEVRPIYINIYVYAYLSTLDFMLYVYAFACESKINIMKYIYICM